ncbi:hypothetical protein EVAR_98254_1 [Eumeta japonica]|uniref:Uncharacterized protein n=1 Tax=Eumeta variegata TaxID=151549 RepID=A0A4C1Y2Y5_EUMVA|nr:hypothetical protein EVAR_98254_1 [Eumeta japonica]
MTKSLLSSPNDKERKKGKGRDCSTKNERKKYFFGFEVSPSDIKKNSTRSDVSSSCTLINGMLIVDFGLTLSGRERLDGSSIWVLRILAIHVCPGTINCLPVLSNSSYSNGSQGLLCGAVATQRRLVDIQVSQLLEPNIHEAGSTRTFIRRRCNFTCP